MKIQTLSIDIETFSDTDLNKCGVYKYAESDAFEILLFGYAANGGSVSVIDLTAGEEIPLEILAALSDSDVIKWVFNASFERVCLSNWLLKNIRNISPATASLRIPQAHFWIRPHGDAA